MKRPLVAGVAVAAALVLVGGTIVAVATYNTATSNLPHAVRAPLTAAQIADYRRIVLGWPYPLAPGDAVPKTPPSKTTPTVDGDRTFVSFFYQCSWVNAAINGSASSRETALESLAAWNDLPQTVSTADNRDGGFKTSVLDPASRGDLAPLKGYFANCTDYTTYRTTPGRGWTIDRPLPVSSTPGALAPSGSSREASVVADLVGPYQVEIPVDNGPENYATGTVTLDAAGHPASYVVASGDVIDYVAHRFGFFSRNGEGFDYLNTINQVRRGGYPWPLYAGDTLNLSAYTMLRVGSINGKVLNDPPPNPLPPQK